MRDRTGSPFWVELDCDQGGLSNGTLGDIGERLVPNFRDRDRKAPDGRLAGFPAANGTFAWIRRLRDR